MPEERLTQEIDELAATNQEKIGEMLRGTHLEAFNDGLAPFAALDPVFGGFVSSLASGRVTRKKIHRVNETLKYLAHSLDDIKDKLNEDYIMSEDFEDLFDETFQKVARERVEAKRKMYAWYLKGAITNIEISYDEKLRFLNLIERLQPIHIMILNAFLILPDEQPNKGSRRVSSSSIMAILFDRLKGHSFTVDLLDDAVAELIQVRLLQPELDNGKLSNPMNLDKDLRPYASSLGVRFMEFLKIDSLLNASPL